MFIEGCITREYLEALKIAGYDFHMCIESGNEASRLNKCELPLSKDHDYEKFPWVRIYLSSDIENLITPDNFINRNNAPFFIHINDSAVKKRVEQILKD